MTCSILISSLASRTSICSRLLNSLNKQKSNLIQVLTCVDDGSIPDYEKKNSLLSMCQTDYLVFIPDFYMVSQNYSSILLRTALSGVDCMGLKCMRSTNGKFPKEFVYDFQCSSVYKNKDQVFSPIMPLCPIKREIAQTGTFRNVVDEDSDFMKQIRPKLKTSIFIDHPMYFYVVHGH